MSTATPARPTVPLPSDLPRSPLPAAAVSAMARVEARLSGRSVADTLAHEHGTYVRSTPEVDKAVVRYEIAAATFDRLSAMDARDMSGNQFDLMAESQDEMNERRAFLESVGQLHRIEVAS